LQSFFLQKNLLMRKLEVSLSPALLHLFDTNDKCVVIIDVFRATSTIATALYNGAVNIIPVATVDGCIALGNSIPNSITAGERDGKVAQGLQYGNSPSEYPASFIEGKNLILTTTNGTRLLHMVENAHSIVIGSFPNLSSVVNYIKGQSKDVILACASWKDRFNLEDALFAGAVANLVKSEFDITCDSAHACMSLDDSANSNYFEYLKRGSHYNRLSGYGLESDMVLCTTVDSCPIIPILDTYNYIDELGSTKLIASIIKG
jgi:2-phosphosulfolactate phosphatase